MQQAGTVKVFRRRVEGRILLMAGRASAMCGCGINMWCAVDIDKLATLLPDWGEYANYFDTGGVLVVDQGRGMPRDVAGIPLHFEISQQSSGISQRARGI